MRTKIAGAAVLILTVLAVLPQQALAVARVTAFVCRDVVIQDAGLGVNATPLSCAREFPTSVPFVILWIQLDDVDMPTTLAWQLLDPGDEIYAKGAARIAPPDPYRKWTIFVYRVLPVASTEKEILERNSRFQYRIIEVGAKPISEMPGQWKLQTSLDGRSTGTITFTLKP